MVEQWVFSSNHGIEYQNTLHAGQEYIMELTLLDMLKKKVNHSNLDEKPTENLK